MLPIISYCHFYGITKFFYPYPDPPVSIQVI